MDITSLLMLIIFLCVAFSFVAFILGSFLVIIAELIENITHCLEAICTFFEKLFKRAPT